MVEINGGYFKNKAGNWQKITTTSRYDPAWSKKGLITKPKEIKKTKPIECAYCKKIKTAIAFHPTDKKTKFCSVEHGKLYMVTHPDTRYTKPKKQRMMESYDE